MNQSTRITSWSDRPYALKSSFTLLLLTLMLLLPVVTKGQSGGDRKSDEYYREIAQGLELLTEVYQEILERYAGSLSPLILAEKGIDGMVGQLDPYSSYLRPGVAESARRMNLRVGVGIDVDTTEGEMMIVDLFPGSQAELQGIRPGDIIVAVDTTVMKGRRVDELYDRLEGAINSPLTLTLLRRTGKEEEKIEVSLERERIRRRSVGYAGMIGGRVAYIDVDRFGENAGNQFRTELIRLLRYERKPEDVDGVIVDLRGNTGGIIDEAVEIANAISPKGSLIVSTDGRDTIEKEEWYAERDPVIPGLRVVLLVDNQSASASEIVAGAIQDHDLGVIIGEPTTGKGLVQSVRSLPYGSSLRLTTAWYLTPSGRSIQRPSLFTGLVPDSLSGEYRTDSGRRISGGVGIYPDSLLPTSPADHFIHRLERLRLFLRFAADYSFAEEEISDDFTIDAKTWEEFKGWGLGQLIASEERRGSLRSLDSLRLAVGGEESPQLTTAWKSLHDEVLRSWRREFESYRKEIESRLEQEIIGLYQTHDERLLQRLRHDRVVETAVNLLTNHKNYQALLGR